MRSQSEREQREQSRRGRGLRGHRCSRAPSRRCAEPACAARAGAGALSPSQPRPQDRAGAPSRARSTARSARAGARPRAGSDSAPRRAAAAKRRPRLRRRDGGLQLAPERCIVGEIPAEVGRLRRDERHRCERERREAHAGLPSHEPRPGDSGRDGRARRGREQVALLAREAGLAHRRHEPGEPAERDGLVTRPSRRPRASPSAATGGVITTNRFSYLERGHRRERGLAGVGDPGAFARAQQLARAPELGHEPEQRHDRRARTGASATRLRRQSTTP